jgi:hypothetical protein
MTIVADPASTSGEWPDNSMQLIGSGVESGAMSTNQNLRGILRFCQNKPLREDMAIFINTDENSNHSNASGGS